MSITAILNTQYEKAQMPNMALKEMTMHTELKLTLLEAEEHRLAQHRLHRTEKKGRGD